MCACRLIASVTAAERASRVTASVLSSTRSLLSVSTSATAVREAWAVASVIRSVSLASASRSAVRCSRAWLATSVAEAIWPRMASTTAPAWAAASAVGPTSWSVIRLARRASTARILACTTAKAPAQMKPKGASARRASTPSAIGSSASCPLRVS